MSDITICHADNADFPALVALWEEAFGDPRELILTFFAQYPPETVGWIVCRGAEVLSAAYLIPGNIFLDVDSVYPAGYVYAVATPKAHRGKGYGGMLMRHLAQEAADHEMLLYTHPAQAALYPWYATNMDAVYTDSVTETRISRQDRSTPLPLLELDAVQYGMQREQHLGNAPHLVLADGFLSLQLKYLRAGGGGMLQVGSGCCAVEKDGETLIVKELLTTRKEFPDAVQTLLQHYDMDTALVRSADANGNPAIAYRSAAPYSPGNWGLLLD